MNEDKGPEGWDIDTAANFRITIKTSPQTSPVEAFGMMCDEFVSRGYDFEAVRARSFKTVLRPVGIDFDTWLVDMLVASTAKDPVMCLKIHNGYFFFARNW